MHRAATIAAVMFSAVACGGSGNGPAAPLPTAPDVPLALSPRGGASVETTNPTLVVQNARGFDVGQATYDFLVQDGTGAVLQRIGSVPAGNGRTEAIVPGPLVRGAVYDWKAVARAGDRTVDSAVASFEVAVPCAAGDTYARAVLDLFVTACTRRTNRAALLDPGSVLGPPDARGSREDNYSNFLSLGAEGYVVVDMGLCVTDAPGPDLRVFQYIESEPVTVRVSGSPSGPWTSLGTKPCGDGGTTDRSNHCDFDLAGRGLRHARYVQVEDAENFPCERAGTRSEGADIDAIQVLSVRP